MEVDSKVVSVFQLHHGRYGRPQVYSEGDSITGGVFPDLTVDLKQVFEDL